MHLKYVVIDMGISDAMFVFPDWLSHDDVASRLQFGKLDKANIVSAGFVKNGQRTGKSISLGVESRKEDTLLLKRMWYDD